jgi:hypothetical protein
LFVDKELRLLLLLSQNLLLLEAFEGLKRKARLICGGEDGAAADGTDVWKSSHCQSGVS